MMHPSPWPRFRLASLGLLTGVLVACGGVSGTTATSTSPGSGGGTSSTSTTTPGSGGSGGLPGTGGGTGIVDQDGDGLDDAYEAMIAAKYLPYLSVDPADGCPLGGIVYRVHPHPANAALIHVVYDFLYQKDCGLN